MFQRLFLLSILSLVFASCARNITSGPGTDNIVIFPSPPDTARIQYLTRISNSHDVAGDGKFITSFLFGKDEDLPINKPYGVAIHNGEILICDTYIRGLVIINMKKNTFERFIPTGKGELKVPLNCFVGKNGYLYIADAERKQVVIFDETLKYVGSIGEAENFKPVDVFVQDDKIWITNLAGHQINVYRNDSSYELLNTFPEVSKSDPNSLFSPTNIYVTDNKVYVTDFGDFKIKIYSHEGEFISSVGSYGEGIGQFSRPKGIAVDRDTNLFVVDAGFENTQIFNKEGRLLMAFGGNYKGPGDNWLPAKIVIDYDNLKYFQKFVDPSFNLKYIILVTNQFGPDKLSIYGAIEPVKPGQKQVQLKTRKKGKRQEPMFSAD
jgi:DNA-binding beta-propeller fold protein YncE